MMTIIWSQLNYTANMHILTELNTKISFVYVAVSQVNLNTQTHFVKEQELHKNICNVS